MGGSGGVGFSGGGRLGGGAAGGAADGAAGGADIGASSPGAASSGRACATAQGRIIDSINEAARAWFFMVRGSLLPTHISRNLSVSSR